MRTTIHRSIQDPTPEAIARYLEALRPFWHPVMLSADLTDKPAVCVLLERQLALARLDGRVVAFDDVCRHMGAALSRGDILDSNRLRCGYHGWTYDAGGRVVEIPGRATAPIPRDACVRAYRCQEAYGLVWVCLDDTPRLPIPDYPEVVDPKFHVIAIRPFPAWSASTTRLVMAALDDSHFPWVHPGILGDPSRPDPPDHKAWIEEGVLLSTYEMEQPKSNTVIAADSAATEMERVSYINYVTPNSVRLVKRIPDGTYVLFNAFLPVSYNHTVPFTGIARDYDCDPAHDQRYLDFNLVVKEQDKNVVEGQRPWLLPPLSSRLMLYVRPADLPIVVFQKWMEELGFPQL